MEKGKPAKVEPGPVTEHLVMGAPSKNVTKSSKACAQLQLDLIPSDKWSSDSEPDSPASPLKPGHDNDFTSDSDSDSTISTTSGSASSSCSSPPKFPPPKLPQSKQATKAKAN